MAHYYPERYLDYVLLRADHLQESWETYAGEAGIDTENPLWCSKPVFGAYIVFAGEANGVASQEATPR